MVGSKHTFFVYNRPFAGAMFFFCTAMLSEPQCLGPKLSADSSVLPLGLLRDPQT